MTLPCNVDRLQATVPATAANESTNDPARSANNRIVDWRERRQFARSEPTVPARS